MKTLLILTGPQGSGNHLFSKLFSLHPDVYGWKELNKTYWIGHDQEPFADYWRDPDLLKNFDWDQSNFYVTSISCPYRDNGTTVLPKYEQFISRLPDYIQCKIAIIGRDTNVLSFQEKRIRGETTYPQFINYLDLLLQYKPIMISQELVYLYKAHYLRTLESILNFPIACDDPMINEILKEDSNTKYFVPIDSHWLDRDIKIASKYNDI